MINSWDWEVIEQKHINYVESNMSQPNVIELKASKRDELAKLIAIYFLYGLVPLRLLETKGTLFIGSPQLSLHKCKLK